MHLGMWEFGNLASCILGLGMLGHSRNSGQSVDPKGFFWDSWTFWEPETPGC